MLIQQVPLNWIIDGLEIIISTTYSVDKNNYCSLNLKFTDDIFQRIKLISYTNITSHDYTWDVNVFKFTNINNIRVNSFVEGLDNFSKLNWAALEQRHLDNSWLLAGKNNNSLIFKFPDEETQTEFNLMYRK